MEGRSGLSVAKFKADSYRREASPNPGPLHACRGALAPKVTDTLEVWGKKKRRGAESGALADDPVTLVPRPPFRGSRAAGAAAGVCRKQAFAGTRGRNKEGSCSAPSSPPQHADFLPLLAFRTPPSGTGSSGGPIKPGEVSVRSAAAELRAPRAERAPTHG